MFVEKRKHARLSIQLDAKIQTESGNVYDGKTKNISFGGLFLSMSPNEVLEEDDSCTVSLLLNKDDDSGPVIPLTFQCNIIHCRKNGYGLQFVCIEGLEAYDHFEKLMILNSDEPDRLMAELEKHPGLIVNQKL
jgi:hypothetical protein